MRQFTKRSAAILTGSVLAVAGGTAAFAYASGWFQGSSNTTVATSTIGNVTATIDLRAGGATNKFFPGKIVQLQGVSLNNPNDYKVKITAVDVITVEGGGDCTQSLAGFSFPELNTSTVFDPGTTASVDLGDLKMSENASELCANKPGIVVKATLKGEVAA
ncbi:hypothetical protein M1L60_17090 [Actinoplanes sp. TRM 88003]|uniref:SipW-cognate class signal peptide n=1 Tax=Paractinoplanes aksuensis TaxID=2939490 RepID=A0ABT1DNA2_9ACTN|nr:hypothetical protein [Actinoplanes aksuensis]MCO8272311.1 hypothetical protein [Actinoplanes aksuensis]